MNQQLALTIAVTLAAAGYLAAAAAYIRLAPWHETPIGRWFVGEHLTMGGVLAMIALDRAIDGGKQTDPIWITAAIGLAVMAWGVFVTIIRTQRQANPPEQHHE